MEPWRAVAEAWVHEQWPALGSGAIFQQKVESLIVTFQSIHTHGRQEGFAEAREERIEICAKAMAYYGVGDPNALDGKGQPRWHWYSAKASKFVDLFWRSALQPKMFSRGTREARLEAALKTIQAQPRLFGGGGGHHRERQILEDVAKIATDGLEGKPNRLIDAFQPKRSGSGG